MVGIGLYVKNSAEAVEFYKKVFDMELGYHVKNEDGSYFHSELSMKGETAFCVCEGSGKGENDVVQLGIEFDSPEDVKRVFKAFSEDGAKIVMEVGELPWSPCAASLIDKYGVWWYFSSLSHRPEDDSLR